MSGLVAFHTTLRLLLFKKFLNRYKNLDPRKSPRPDLFNPYFLKLTADLVADPLAFLFNLKLERNESPSAWKSAFVLPPQHSNFN